MKLSNLNARLSVICSAAFVLMSLALALALALSLALASEALAQGAPSESPAATSQAATPATAPQKPAENAKPEKVIVGVYVNDIQEVSFPTYSYSVDIYVWFRWTSKDKNPAKTAEFMNRYAPNDHQRDILLDEPKVMPDGTLYNVLREQGRFATKFKLARFPFDEQMLKVVIEDSVSGTGEFVYVPDSVPVTLNPAITLPGFRVGTPSLRVADNGYPTNFGDLTVGPADKYSRVTLEIPIRRALVSITVKAFLPILLIIVCASLIFFIVPTRVDGRIGLGITALLTLVALQLTASTTLPEVGYLMLIDKIYLASYGFIIAALARVVATSWSGEPGGDIHRVAATDKRWAAFLLSLYLAIVAGCAYWTFWLIPGA